MLLVTATTLLYGRHKALLESAATFSTTTLFHCSTRAMWSPRPHIPFPQVTPLAPRRTVLNLQIGLSLCSHSSLCRPQRLTFVVYNELIFSMSATSLTSNAYETGTGFGLSVTLDI